MKVCASRVAHPLSGGLLRHMPANRPLRPCIACPAVTRGVRLGLCVACYTRKYRRGTTERVPSRSAEERFDAKVNKTDSCWLWTGGLAQDGYGAFWYGGRTGLAHRYSYEQFVGQIQEGACVCHKCDVPLCVRPDHLFAGSNSENIADRDAKGRMSRGVASPLSKFSEDDVREIRRRHAGGPTFREIAGEFATTPTNVRFIVTRRTWKHVA